MRLVIDRIEGDVAVLLVPSPSDQVIEVPVALLAGAREGDTVELGLVDVIPAPWSAWTLTGRGRALDLHFPAADDVDLDEIAWSLARQCRYAGDIRPKPIEASYSVAEHSVLIAEWLAGQGHPRDVVLAGLLHDAAEAYTGDLTWPVQRVLFGASPAARSAYREMKARLDAIIADKAGIDPALLHCEPVGTADLRILLDERAALLGANPRRWDVEERGLTPLGVRIQCWPAAMAHYHFARCGERLGLEAGWWRR